MLPLRPVTLEGHAIRLEPLAAEHEPGLCDAVMDGQLWQLWYAGVPRPEDVQAYIAEALAAQGIGRTLAWAVRDCASGTVIGTTRFHDVEPQIDRLYIGATWYARRWQRTHVNSACKLLLLMHAFETLDSRVVGFRTDSFNVASQRAIAALGAHRDGVLRHHQARRDGTVRDTVFFSILNTEWADVKRHLVTRLARNQDHSTDTDAMT